MWSRLVFNRTTISYLVIVGVIAFVGYKFYSLERTIDNLKQAVLERDLVISNQRVEIETRKNNELVLSNALDLSNKKIESISIDNEKLKDEVYTWKNKKPNIQYVVKNKVITKENCEHMVNEIKKLNYKNL